MVMKNILHKDNGRNELKVNEPKTKERNKIMHEEEDDKKWRSK